MYLNDVISFLKEVEDKDYICPIGFNNPMVSGVDIIVEPCKSISIKNMLGILEYASELSNIERNPYIFLNERGSWEGLSFTLLRYMTGEVYKNNDC